MERLPDKRKEFEGRLKKLEGHLKVQEGMAMAKDPVCGMNVNEEKAAATAVHEGKTYYFCSPGCKATFDKDPGKYARI